MADGAAAEVLQECIHGITEAFCSLCKSKKLRQPARRRSEALWGKAARIIEVERTVLAQYDSECRGCGGHIYESDPIHLVDGVWVCDDCGGM